MERVIIKQVTGIAKIAWIVSISERLFYATDFEGYLQHMRGEKPSRVIGFPKDDVYEIMGEISVGDGDLPDWETMKNYGATTC